MFKLVNTSTCNFYKKSKKSSEKCYNIFIYNVLCNFKKQGKL